MATSPRILFIINEEHGQANVCLGAIYELLIRGDNEIHLASWPKLERHMRGVGAIASKKEDLLLKRKPTVTFHALPGLGMVRSIYRFVTDSIPCSGRGVRSCPRIFSEMKLILGSCRTPDEYLEVLDACTRIIQNVKPHLVVLEPFMACGFDACRRLDQRFVVLAPNALKDVALFEQPILSVLCKYPALGTGFAYPVPLVLVPLNICIIFLLVFVLSTASEFKALAATRKKRGITSTYPLLEPYNKSVQYLCSSCPESDFPLKVPKNVTPCGPILLPVPHSSQTDPALSDWLHRCPTVFIHFGSHFIADEAFAREMVGAIRKLLDRCPEMQVLWKHIKLGDYNDDFAKPLEGEMNADRVRMTGWLEAHPLSILQTGQVACIVHHGGTTSYNEAISVGVPQVICPLWLDCLDYAARVEWLGIGVDGNRKVGFPIESEELGDAMIKTISNVERLRERCQVVAMSCQKYGGRLRAADKIMELAVNEYQ